MGGSGYEWLWVGMGWVRMEMGEIQGEIGMVYNRFGNKKIKGVEIMGMVGTRWTWAWQGWRWGRWEVKHDLKWVVAGITRRIKT